MNSEEKTNFLDPKVKILWSFTAVLSALISYIFLLIITPLAFPRDFFGISSSFYPVFFFFLIGAILIPYLVYIELKYRNYFYTMGKTELIIRKGILKIERSVIPYEKIQNVNVSRSIYERLLGLATLKIETAGSNPGEAEGIIEGVGNFEETVNQILERVEHARSYVHRLEHEIVHEAEKKEHQGIEENLNYLKKEVDNLKKMLVEVHEEVEKLKQRQSELLSIKAKKIKTQSSKKKTKDK